jgi:uracil permease
MATAKMKGYLPNDRPALGPMLALGFQHVLTMFPATVLVAILTRFDIGVTLFASGLATVIALIISSSLSGSYIPLYYGSSFSYIAPVVAIVSLNTVGDDPTMGIRIAQGGIMLTGVANVLIGILIRFVGKASLDKVLPPSITGPVAMVIGIALGKTALDMASGACCLTDAAGAPTTDGTWWAVAIVTLLATIMFSVYLRGHGFIGMLPVLLGAGLGYLVAIPLGLVHFGPVLATFGKPIFTSGSWLAVPHFTMPIFQAGAVFAIAPIAIATIPESTAHLYQISLYVDRLAGDLGRKPVELKRLIGLNLVCDGVGDMVNGVLGGCAGTNYGENNSLMVITRNYSGPVLLTAGVIAMALGFFNVLAQLVSTLPTAVTGGLAIYLFGIIGLQGVALMMSEQVDLFDPRQLAIGGLILIVGIGGSVGYPDGMIPLWGMKLPAIATAAVVGILLNLVFVIFPGPAMEPAAVPEGPPVPEPEA